MSATESLLNIFYQIQRQSQQPVSLDIDHPTPSPEPSVQTSTLVQPPSHSNNFATSIGRPQLNAQVWASPAFLKRSHFVASDYDPLAEEEFLDNDREKRTKFGRGSSQWRFAERTPSPEKGSETPPPEIASPSRLLAQGRPRGAEVRSLVQQGHGTRLPSRALNVATIGLTDLSELEVQFKDDPTAKDTLVEEEEEPSTSVSQVNGGRHMIYEATKDQNTGNMTIITPRTPHTKLGLYEIDILEMGEEVDSSVTGSTSPTSSTDNVDVEVSQEPAKIAQALPSAPIGIPSSTSSTSTPEGDPESDEELDHESEDAPHQESDSHFDEQSESGQSNAAVYSGPTSDFGVDGSTFSRPPPLVDFAPPSSVIKRLEEGLEADSLNTDNARDNPCRLQNDVEQTESEAEEQSISTDSAAELLLSGDEGSGKEIEMGEAHDAAQRRSSVQVPSSDQLGSPEVQEIDDEAMKDLAAAQLLADDRGSCKDVDFLRDESAVRQSSSSPPSSSDQSESHKPQEEFVRRSHKIPDGETAPKMVPEKSPADFPEGESPISGREEGDLSGTSDEKINPKTSPEKGLADPAVRQESRITHQQEVVLDTRLSQEELKIVPTQGQDVRDRAESVGMLFSKIQQTTVEIIDLESGDEDDISPQNVGQEGLQVLVDKNNSEFARTNETSAGETPLSLISDAGNEHQTSIYDAYRPSTLPDSTGLALKPVDEFPLVDVHLEPEAHQEAFQPETEGSRKQSQVVRNQWGQEELPSTEEAPSQLSQEARLTSKERKLSFKEEPRLKQSSIAETELEPTPLDVLPSTVTNSFEDKTAKSQLLTPSSTQRTNLVSQPSSISLQSAPEDDTLPTPRLTQGTSAGIVPPQPLAPPDEPTCMETPAPPKKTSALIEKLKEMRRLSNQSPKHRSSDASLLDPWFAPKRRLSQMIPDSEDESEAERLPEREAQADISKIVGSQLPQTPERPLAKSFIRSPPQPTHISSIQSSPQYLPPSQSLPPGFRTNLSYFVPLATLPSHFATTVDILAIALSSTPVTRATSGPMDYNQTLYFTDPSSLALQRCITTAQTFRPNNRCFPLVEKGDALLLRNFKVQPFQRRLSLLSMGSSAWAVFRKGADVQIRGPPVEFGAEERGFARGLWDWWTSLGDDARKRFEDAVPEYKKANAAKTMKSRAGGNKTDAPTKKEEIKGIGVDLPGSQTKRRESMTERSLDFDDVQERDMVHESIEAPKRVLRARGAKSVNGRSESARESRYGTVFTGGLGEPDKTQGSGHEGRDRKG